MVQVLLELMSEIAGVGIVASNHHWHIYGRLWSAVRRVNLAYNRMYAYF